jgi:hypothetical protein
LALHDHGINAPAVDPLLTVIAGAVLGIGVGIACCAPARARLRMAIRTQVRAMKHRAVTFAARIGNRTHHLAEPSNELAQRIRLAARAGLSEARRHLAVVREPSRERLAGVEGLAECP